MRTVGSNEDVANAFARRVPEFRNGKSTFYIEDGVLYSYGPHFPMARWTDGALLVTTETYSNTTAAHMSAMWRALGYRRHTFHVRDVRAVGAVAHESNLINYISRLKLMCADSWKKRTDHTLAAVWEDFRSTISEATQYRNRFLPGLKCTYLDNPCMFVLKTRRCAGAEPVV